MNPPAPELAEDTARLARVYALDTDPAGEVIAALLQHITVQEVYGKTLLAEVRRSEAHALDQARQVSVCASPTPIGWIS